MKCANTKPRRALASGSRAAHVIPRDSKPPPKTRGRTTSPASTWGTSCCHRASGQARLPTSGQGGMVTGRRLPRPEGCLGSLLPGSVMTTACPLHAPLWPRAWSLLPPRQRARVRLTRGVPLTGADPAASRRPTRAALAFTGHRGFVLTHSVTATALRSPAQEFSCQQPTE